MDTFPNVTTTLYAHLRQEIRSGDILLCSGTSGFSTLIQQATKSVWSHVGFILRIDAIDRIMVLESVESIGVRTVPLSSYVTNYCASGQPYPGRIMIARHQAFQANNIVRLSKVATSLLGYPYDNQEIARIAARIGLHSIGFENHTKDIASHKEFICSEYAYVCFQSVGIDIPYDKLGFIAPADFARCPEIKPLSYVETT